MIQLHPLTLVPLNLCDELLDAWPDLASLFSNQLHGITDAMRNVSQGKRKESDTNIAGCAENMNDAESIFENFLFWDA